MEAVVSKLTDRINKPLVIIESPFAGEVERNSIYLKRCILDSIKNHNEAPFASHGLYTQVLDDTIPEDRKLGMEAGFSVIKYSEYSAAYVDYGISGGMEEGIRIAQEMGHRVDFRRIGLNPRTVLYDNQSSDHRIMVVDEYPVRKLLFGFGFCSEQSAIDLSKQSSHVFDYSLLAMHSFLFNPEPSRILVLGLGGGIIPTEMEKYTANIPVDVVEIDREVVDVAKKFFFFKETDRLRVYIEDALSFVTSSSNRYDIVVVDVFLSNYTPYHLMTEEFFKAIYNCTSDDAVVVVNTANSHHAFLSQVKTISHVFGNNIYHIDGFKNKNTTMIFALKKEKPIVKLGGKLICHFLVAQPERMKLTNEIMSAKIFRMDKE